MKVPRRPTRKVQRAVKKRKVAYATLIYRAQKAGSHAYSVGPVFRRSPSSCPKRVLLGLVGLEASRLSKTNRRRTITHQEVNAAVALVRQRTFTRAAA